MYSFSAQGANLLTLAVIILLPIIPAYLLFKALPRSQAGVEGPFQGLQIKLGGAFAGYFLMELLVLGTHRIWAPPPTYQVWELNARVTDENDRPIQQLVPSDIGISPPVLIAQQDGAFKLTFFTTTTPNGAAVEYPMLTVTHNNLDSGIIVLDPDWLKAHNNLKANTNAAAQRIDIDHIALKPLPPYAGAGLPPAPVPASVETNQ